MAAPSSLWLSDQRLNGDTECGDRQGACSPVHIRPPRLCTIKPCDGLRRGNQFVRRYSAIATKVPPVNSREQPCPVAPEYFAATVMIVSGRPAADTVKV